jgi:hypothetical protein
MDSDDERFIGMLMMSALVGVVSGILIGSGHATSRIYDRCLEDNSLMIYQDAAAKCKKIVGDDQ